MKFWQLPDALRRGNPPTTAPDQQPATIPSDPEHKTAQHLRVCVNSSTQNDLATVWDRLAQTLSSGAGSAIVRNRVVTRKISSHTLEVSAMSSQAEAEIASFINVHIACAVHKHAPDAQVSYETELFSSGPTDAE
ncbi:hypothetical protein [Corynebacterium epidermidicanis]|uniref:Uncharacterized protein n=1 Tax=Corynebacterium epidermidicanis TaxID=1050174 RepID=A0A0G3GRJ6_9CORY|nr:hypothetical protein [Corynebacterium epidermidicanis]AKK02153.1 hypothetical protein CEPID_01330 [Corynebacterium epidermidicanis]